MPILKVGLLLLSVQSTLGTVQRLAAVKRLPAATVQLPTAAAAAAAAAALRLLEDRFAG